MITAVVVVETIRDTSLEVSVFVGENFELVDLWFGPLKTSVTWRAGTAKA